MAEKILNTRIQLKYDTLANWNASTFLLKRGELAIVEVPTAEGTTLPPVMFKVGTGDKKFSELDWASAKAADVYGWAKKSEAEFKTYIAEYVKTVDLSNYYTKAEIDALLKAITDAASALAGRVTTLEGKYDIDKKLSVIVSEIEGKINAVDTGVMSVTGKDAIAVTSGKNPEVSLKLDASGNVVLSQSSTGLKATIDLSDYALNENIPTEEEIKSAAIAAVEALIKSSDDTNSKVVIENINALVDYVNKNAGDIAELVKNVGTANTNASNAVSTANTAKSTAEGAATVAGEAKSLAEDAMEAASDAKTGAAASAAAAAKSAEAAADSAADALAEKNAAVEAKAAAVAAQGAAESAKSAAETAKADAVTAQGKAEDAQEAAEAAQSAAELANTNAGKAQTAAEAAQGKAEAAKTAAEKAKSDANTILGQVTDAATGAQATANTAVQTANAANKTAGEAKTAAAGAVSTANAAKAAADTAVQTVTAPAGEGIKATRTGNNVVIGFDSNVVFVFDCGNATDKIYE